MQVEITINCDNAAFDDLRLRAEVARILHEIGTNLVLDGELNRSLLDSNGNEVGEVRFT